MKRIRIRGCYLAVLLVALPLSQAGAEDYLVVDLAGAGDPYHAAAERLAELRRGKIVPGDPNNLRPLVDVLREARPSNVAVVVRPQDLDINLARSFLKLATQVDKDPFVDFAYGFITGDTPEVAVALAETGVKAEKTRRKPELAVAAVGEKVITRSALQQQQFPLRKKSIPQLWGQIAGGENFPETGRDAAFIAELMPRMQGKSLVLLAGHGYPREVVGGPTFKDFAGLNFERAVMLNIACYTGVTGRWFEDDHDAGVRRERHVTDGESLCLAALRTGVAAYVGYACPRPAGPELFLDIAALATEGVSVGEARRRDYNRVVLAHLAQGFRALSIDEYADGERIRPPQNIVRDLLLDMATGGMLFGDPAFQPFEGLPGESPVEVTTTRDADRISVTVSVGPQHVFFECSEPLATWGPAQLPTLRLLARVPLGQSHVADVLIKELRLGGEIAAKRLVWAVEEHAGERLVHVKAIFPQPPPDKLLAFATAAKAVFEIVTTADPDEARTRFVQGDVP